MVLSTALCSWPCILHLGKHRLTGAKPHAVFHPANITTLYLHFSSQPLLFSAHKTDNIAVAFIPCRGSCCILMQGFPGAKNHVCLYDPKHESVIFIIQENLTSNYFCAPSTNVIFFTASGTNFFFQLCFSSPTNTNNSFQQQRCRGMILALSCQRSPTAGRAHPTQTWSTAPSSPTSATPDSSWWAPRSSCASGISPGALMCRDARKVRGSTQKQHGQS